jgi:hypothetical protein
MPAWSFAKDANLFSRRLRSAAVFDRSDEVAHAAEIVVEFLLNSTPVRV